MVKAGILSLKGDVCIFLALHTEGVLQQGTLGSSPKTCVKERERSCRLSFVVSHQRQWNADGQWRCSSIAYRQSHSAGPALPGCLPSLFNSLSAESLAGRTKRMISAFCPARTQSTGRTAPREYGRWEYYKRLSAKWWICIVGNQTRLKNTKAMVQDFHGDEPLMYLRPALMWGRSVNHTPTSSLDGRNKKALRRDP